MRLQDIAKQGSNGTSVLTEEQLKQLHQVLLEILDDVIQICQEHASGGKYCPFQFGQDPVTREKFLPESQAVTASGVWEVSGKIPVGSVDFIECQMKIKFTVAQQFFQIV